MISLATKLIRWERKGWAFACDLPKDKKNALKTFVILPPTFRRVSGYDISEAVIGAALTFDQSEGSID